MMGKNVVILTPLEVLWMYGLCLASQRQLWVEANENGRETERGEGGAWREEGLSSLSVSLYLL